MINWLKLDYLFTNYMAPISSATFKLATIVYLLFFIAAIVFSFIRKGKEIDKLYVRLFQRLGNWCFSLSIVGLLLMFFRHQLVPYLGMRAWSLLWWLICAIWMIYILKYLLVNIPKQKKKLKIKEEFEKYLP